jgi:VWFA-related protein
VIRIVAASILAAVLLQTGTGDLVELDVVVLDRDNRPILGLEPKDFRIKEDGKPVEVKTFTPAEPPSSNDERQLVLLLDDSSVPLGGTPIIQALAQAILSRRTPRDEVTVVRLNNSHDEPFGDLETAMTRIDGYRAGAVPFQSRGTAERALTVIAAISRQLEAVEHRRKLIVCIGGPRVCNVLEPQPRGYSVLWKPWVSALTAAARANVAVYAVMPIAPGVPLMLAGGIADLTGGDGFSNSANFDRFVTTMWEQASSYYLLGYWPAETRRDLHSIDVKVARKGARVRARRTRG